MSGQEVSAPEPSSNSTSRRWKYTLNNYTEEDIARLKSVPCLRHVCGKEKAPTTGTPHLQGYIRFKEPCRFSWWKNNFPRAYAREIKGRRNERHADRDNEAYCSKDGEIVINTGHNVTLDTEGLTRNEEMDMIIDEAEDGLSYGQIRQRHKRFCAWNRKAVWDVINDTECDKNGWRHPTFYTSDNTNSGIYKSTSD